MSRFLRIDDVARITGVSANTLRYWRHQGIGPPSGRLGRRVVYRLDDLEAWIESEFERTASR